MSNKAKERIDTMLAAGVTPKDTRGGAVILKGVGARYHQLVGTTGEKHAWVNTMKQKQDRNCPLAALTQGKRHIGRGIRNTFRCATAKRK